MLSAFLMQQGHRWCKGVKVVVESLWNVPDHEVEVGSLPARTEAAALRIKSGPVDRAADIDAIASSMDVRLDVAAESDIDVSPGVQFLGGTEPYEDA